MRRGPLSGGPEPLTEAEAHAKGQGDLSAARNARRLNPASGSEVMHQEPIPHRRESLDQNDLR